MPTDNCGNGQLYHYWQCYTLEPDYIGGRGVTYWGFPNGYNVDIAPDGTATFSFTCTTPKCFSDSVDNCNIYFNAYAKSNTDPEPDANLTFKVNGTAADGYWVSGVANHGARQGFDITQVDEGNAYNDLGANTFTIHNQSDVTVAVEDFKIMRVYPMCNLSLGQSGECDGTLGIMCPERQEEAPNGNLDADNPPYDGRHDEPCNCEDYGSISFTTYNNASFAHTTIDPLATLEVTFDWTDYSTLNYVRGSVCVFNFNQMYPTTLSTNTDVTLTAYLNNEATPFTTYYLSNQKEHMSYPSYDLMQATGYDDDGPNTVKLVNNSDVPVKLNDDHGINIYRTYVTSPITCYCTCQTCQTCYACQTCEETCELTCQTACETCESCYGTCETPCDTCQSCYSTCETPCDTCEWCVTCQTCYPCYICYTCMTCQSACELACQDCQEACQISCQECQVPCDVCEICYPCHICYSWYT